jgi:hypothetical protein
MTGHFYNSSFYVMMNVVLIKKTSSMIEYYGFRNCGKNNCCDGIHFLFKQHNFLTSALFFFAPHSSPKNNQILVAASVVFGPPALDGAVGLGAGERTVATVVVGATVAGVAASVRVTAERGLGARALSVALAVDSRATRRRMRP